MAARGVERWTFGRDGPPTAGAGDPCGGMTDIGEAVESAVALSLAAPFPTRRSVLNILSNGVANDGPSPDAVRAHAIRLGMTINGIGFGPRVDLYRTSVGTGRRGSVSVDHVGGW